MEYLMSDGLYLSFKEVFKTVSTSNFMMIGIAVSMFIGCIRFIVFFVKSKENEENHE